MAEEKKNEKREKYKLPEYDVELPEDIIAADKDTARKEAFKETEKRIKKIVPSYFEVKKKKPTGGTSGGTAFSQSIVVTQDKAVVETKEVKQTETEKEDRERDD